MTQLNLFLEVLDTVTRLLKVGADASTTHEARRLIDSLVADFEESQGVYIGEENRVSDEVEQTPLEAMLIKIATKERTIPQDLKDYFLVTEHSQVKHHHIENEIFFRGLPPLNEEITPEEAKLRIGIFSILNDLLKAGVTSCTMHESHMELDALLAEHEQIQRDIEDYEMETFKHHFSNIMGGKTYGAI